MRVHLLLFAAHREIVGKSAIDMEVPEGSTAENLYHRLESERPELAALRPYTTFAVNRQVVAGSTVLHSGDEVAFLQPVSGGTHD